MPGAVVTAKAVATGTERSTITNERGMYTLANLLPGAYAVSVQVKRFKTARQRAEVHVGARVGMDFHREVGQMATTVEVNGEATSVELNTETQTISDLISSRNVVELPTLTRNPYDLILTAGNVSEADPAAANNQVGQGGRRGHQQPARRFHQHPVGRGGQQRRVPGIARAAGTARFGSGWPRAASTTPTASPSRCLPATSWDIRWAGRSNATSCSSSRAPSGRGCAAPPRALSTCPHRT